jgi:metal-dependent amidase/aminoacylase/carboxypeptidase family protein
MNKEQKNKLIALRKTLHTYPNLSGEEQETANRIVSFIKNYQPDEIIEQIGTCGLAFPTNVKFNLLIISDL